MTSPVTPAASSELAATAVAAHDKGRKLFLMLQASSFSDDEKAAWASLLPSLSLAEIDRLMQLLEKNLNDQIVEEFEDVFLRLKAAKAKHDLSKAALSLQTAQGLDALEQELELAEKQ